MLHRSTSSARPTAVLVAVMALGIGLAGCAPSPDPAPTPTMSADAEAAPEPSPSPSAPASPEFVPDGTADDNLPVFTAVVEKVWKSKKKEKGRAYIDALVEAGFDKSDMQVTRDQSTVGRRAESLQFSVRWGDDQCLVGQVGPSTGSPVTAVLDQLAEGRCLVGKTRPIDW